MCTGMQFIRMLRTNLSTPTGSLIQLQECLGRGNITDLHKALPNAELQALAGDLVLISPITSDKKYLAYHAGCTGFLLERDITLVEEHLMNSALVESKRFSKEPS